ncbi:hypothetical protein [Ferrimonas pelagia]|uniref:Uncharacterized protein n=1 Tax=Ferrimonas pelagia TaxID=1177826 RepID=A0ABP9EN26_9GAMM
MKLRPLLAPLLAALCLATPVHARTAAEPIDMEGMLFAGKNERGQFLEYRLLSEGRLHFWLLTPQGVQLPARDAKIRWRQEGESVVFHNPEGLSVRFTRDGRCLDGQAMLFPDNKGGDIQWPAVLDQIPKSNYALLEDNPWMMARELLTFESRCIE